jgi:tRNA(fMet)-specific endonuclease VapC
LAYLNRAQNDSQVLRAYAELEALLRWFSRMNVLGFNEAAQDRFKSIRKQSRRVGTLDLRIASITLTAESTLLSRNLRDFRLVPGLSIEDWTR